MKRIILAIAVAVGSLSASAQINVAGVYEGDMNDNITRKRMYADLDFLNNVPDFTQTFKEKTAPLKILPADFMNAKKLKKNFVGQTAPGFIKYNSRTLFSSTEEIKLTNPHLEDGVLAADWTNHEGKSGKCFIIVKPDNTIQFLGLTTLDPELGPDNLVLNRVEDKLPTGAMPYTTPDNLFDKINKRYCREILWKVKVNSSKGLSGVKPTIDVEQVRRIGNSILIPIKFQNTASKEARPYFGSHNPYESSELATINGTQYRLVSWDSNLEKNIGANETAMQRFVMPNVPLDAQKVDNFKVQGRAQYTHSTDNNPYGEFEYVFTDLVLPELRPSNRQGTFVTDSDLQLNFDEAKTEGDNLVVYFTLVNHSNREKQLSVNDRGIARNNDGEEFAAELSLPKTLMANDLIKGQMTIYNAGKELIKLARAPFTIVEPRIGDYQAIIQF